MLQSDTANFLLDVEFYSMAALRAIITRLKTKKRPSSVSCDSENRQPRRFFSALATHFFEALLPFCGQRFVGVFGNFAVGKTHVEIVEHRLDLLRRLRSCR